MLHPQPDPDESDQALADRLARTFYEHRDARLVCRRAGFDLAHLPSFGRPVAFWSEVIAAAHAGANAGGVAALVDAAAKLVPNSRGARLDPGYVSLPANPAPSQYLVARYGVVEFTGRERELAELDAWADQSGTVAVRLIYGPGGAGKTRLLLEWVKRRGEAGELAGFLRDEIDDAVIEWLDEAQQATLVIDYAETRAGLLDLVHRLAPSRTEDGPRRVRVVLLARNAGDWWASLLERNEEVRALLANSPVPLPVEPLVASDERAREFSRAAGCFAVRRGRGMPSHAPVLNDPRFGRALYLHMAAFAAVEGLAAGVDQLLDDLLEHEARFWLRRAGLEGGGVDRDAIGEFLDAARASVGAITLRGGVGDKPQAELVIGRFTQEHAKRLVRLARELYPHPGDGWIGGLEPDLLGEALVRRLLVDRRVWPRWIDDAMVDAEPQGWAHAFTVLGRVEDLEPSVASVYPRLLTGHIDTRAVATFDAVMALGERTAHSRLGLELSNALAVEGTTELARSLDRVPERTTMLLEVAVWIDRKVLESTQSEQERARRLTHLGNRLSALGHREQALAAALEAVSIYRKLADARGAFLLYLARSLNNLGLRLAELGRREEALSTTLEAIDIQRTLAASHPATFLPDLASSLTNLGLRLAELGRREEALSITLEAVELQRKLAVTRPDAFLPNLAISLGNLGVLFSDMGYREKALAIALEAVDVQRKLASARPDAFLPNLGMSLGNLGALLSGLGHHEQALSAALEAVDVQRKLAIARPDAFLPDLAMSLSNLGLLLSELGHYDRALPATLEAVDVRRLLANARPDAFLPDLASSLNNLGLVLSKLGRREEALSATLEAVDVRRKLADASWDAFLPDLAASLSNMGACLLELGHREEALSATVDAVSTYRTLAGIHPDAFLPDLARSLNNLGVLLSRLGHREEGLSATVESVSTYRTLAGIHPDVFLPMLAGSLSNLGNRLSELGRREAALPAVVEAVSIYRTLTDARPDAFLPDLARSLGNYASVLHALGRDEEADAAYCEGLDRVWDHFERLPHAFANLTGWLLKSRRALVGNQAPDLLARRLTRFQELLATPDKNPTD